jgi:guanine deaminase
VQRLTPEGFTLDPAHLLYLATRAGAVALGLDEEVGDFTPGRSADFVYLRPPAASPLAAIADRSDNPEQILGALFTLAGAESVCEVRVANTVVHTAAPIRDDG